jgi:hypothetical protein
MVTTDAGGVASFTSTFGTGVPLGQFITATATDPNNNTSQFSQCVEVAGPGSPGGGAAGPAEAGGEKAALVGILALTPGSAGAVVSSPHTTTFTGENGHTSAGRLAGGHGITNREADLFFASLRDDPLWHRRCRALPIAESVSRYLDGMTGRRFLSDMEQALFANL